MGVTVLGNNRKGYLDQAKGIGIMLVVLAHLSNRLYVGNDLLAIWINSFHLPIFFIVAGYLFFLKQEAQRPFGQFMKHKAAGLLYPYFTFSGLFILIDLVYLLVTTKTIPIKQAISALFRVLSGWGIGTLWFLPVLFLCELLFWMVLKSKSRWMILLILLCCAAIGGTAGHSINVHFTENGAIQQALIYRIANLAARSLIALPFMGIGYFYARCEEKTDQKMPRAVKFITGIILLALTISLTLFHGEINLRIALIDNLPLYYLTGTAGTISLLMLFREIKEVKWLSFIGLNSLIIMATHEPYKVMDFVQWCLEKMGIMNASFAHHYLHVAIAFVLTMMLEIILIFLINRFAAFMIKFPVRKAKERMEDKK